MINIYNIGHAFGKKRVQENRLDVKIDRDDELVAHASREVCTYVCDVMYRMGIRTYNDHLAKRIANQMLEQLTDVERWGQYLESTAPKIGREMVTLLGIADTEP